MKEVTSFAEIYTLSRIIDYCFFSILGENLLIKLKKHNQTKLLTEEKKI